MTSYFLHVEDKEADSKINIDELYERAQKHDLKQLSIFKKILNRIHVRIRQTSHNKKSEKYIWFHVPEYIFGEPLYDKGDCIGFLIFNLQENHFHIRYIHPNTLFISWEHWVPAYVRAEFKKKTGKIMDEFGVITDPAAEAAAAAESAPEAVAAAAQKAKNFKPPNFIYGDVMEKIERVMTPH
jgi:hypothetical protein